MSARVAKAVPSVRPFSFELPRAEINDLRRRIRATRFPASSGERSWEYGVDNAYLRGLLQYWARDFDWDAWVDVVNQHPQFKVEIDGVDIHFRHIRAATANSLPLVLLHGWPGSSLEFDKMIPHLLGDLAPPASQIGFDLVIPSLPGIGFSGRQSNPPMTKERMAGLINTLMTRVLGYPHFGVHGGDIGSGIATRLGYHFGESLIGLHLTYLLSEPPKLTRTDSSAKPAERRYLGEVERWYSEEGAYSYVQSTKPLTLGYALNDSPAGLLAWLLDKYRMWSDCGGDVESRFSRFELLSVVSLYWFTQSISSSMSLYFDNRNRVPLTRGARVEVPTAVAVFPNEYKPEGSPPRALAERTFNLQRWTRYRRGGHFSALEEPAVLAADIAAFFAGLIDPADQSLSGLGRR